MQPSPLEPLPDDVTHVLGESARLVERELITIWRQDPKGKWYTIRYAVSRAVPA